MRRHAVHSPQASRSRSPDETGCRQLIAGATATAVMRLPTPAGPAMNTAGGIESRAIARASSVRTRECPAIVRKGTPYYRPKMRRQKPRFDGVGGGDADAEAGAGAGAATG